MADKFLLSNAYLRQIREDHEKLKRLPRPQVYNQGRHAFSPKLPRIFAKITGKYNGALSASYPAGATYTATMVIGDSAGTDYTLVSDVTWGGDTSASYLPIIDITSLGPYHKDDDNLKRIPDNTIVEVFFRGDLNESGTRWYCEAPEQEKPESFQAEILDNNGTEQVRIHEGYVYGRGHSDLVASTTFNTSDGLWVYVQYTLNIANDTITVNGIYSQASRPTEITTSCTTRIMKIPLVSFATDSNSNLIMTRWHEGDISTLEAFAHKADNGDSCGLTDLTYSSEHSEAANSSTWNVASTNEGVTVTICTGISYYEAGDQILYQYTRDFVFDTEGKLVSVSAETRTTVETPEAC